MLCLPNGNIMRWWQNPEAEDPGLFTVNKMGFRSLQWRHNEQYGVSNHQRLDCLLYRLFRRKSTKTSKLPVTGLCEGNSTVTGEFPAQRTSNAENVSIWWRHHVTHPNHCVKNLRWPLTTFIPRSILTHDRIWKQTNLTKSLATVPHGYS